MNYKLNIAYLYPESMNIYGDRGNIITLINRSKKRGIKIIVNNLKVTDKFEGHKYDLVFAGGGQDSGQKRIYQNLLDNKGEILTAVNRGVVFLLVCGSYQLFGHYFKTAKNKTIKGIGVLDLYTEAGQNRKIGNLKIKLDSDIYNFQDKTLVGFENHSGNTFFENIHKNNDYNLKTVPLGKVISGYGNNDQANYEGARYKNVFGTYLHGSLLPKNPEFADYLLKLALENKYQKPIRLTKLNDDLENLAHKFIIDNR